MAHLVWHQLGLRRPERRGTKRYRPFWRLASGASLYKAELVGANLSKADLTSANLAKAKLVDADLCQASLVRADIEDAALKNAYLKGARLDMVLQLAQEFLPTPTSIIQFGLPVPPEN